MLQILAEPEMQKNAISQIFVTVTARFVNKTVNFFVFLILARELSVNDFGIYGFFFAASILVSTGFDLGIRSSIAFYIGRSPEHTNAYTWLVLKMFLAVALPAAGTMYVIGWFHDSAHMSPSVLFAIMSNLCALLFIRMSLGVLIGEGRISELNQVETTSRVTLFLGVGLLYATSSITLATAFLVLAVSNFCGALALLWHFRRAILSSNVRNTVEIQPVIVRGLKFMVGVLAMLTAKQTAFLIVSKLGVPLEAGVYFALDRLSQILTEIGLSVSVVLFSQSVRESNRQEAIKSAAHFTRISISIFTIFTLAALGPTEWLLQLAFGAPYSDYANLFRILLIGTLLGTIWVILFPSLSAIDKPAVVSTIFISNLAIGGPATALLFNEFGIYGAAIGTLLLNLSISVSFLLTFKYRYNASVLDFIFIKREDLDIIFSVFSVVINKIRKRP